MEHFLTLTFTALDMCNIFLFVDTFLTRKRSGPWIAALFFWQGMLSIFLTSIHDFLFGPDSMIRIPKLLLALLSLSLILRVAYRGSLLLHLVLGATAELIEYLWESFWILLVCSAFQIDVHTLLFSVPLFIGVGTSVKLSLFLGMLLLHRRPLQVQPCLPRGYRLALFLFSLASILSCMSLLHAGMRTADMAPLLLPCVLFMALISVFVQFLMHQLEQTAQNAERAKLLEHQLQLQTQDMTALKRSYEAQQKLNHDRKRHFGALRELLHNGDYIRAEEYLTDLLGKQTDRIFAVTCNHPMLDAVLNQKYSRAQECGIDLRYIVSDLSQLKMPDPDLVVLTSNLLDNAIEACQKYPGTKEIDARLTMDSDGFMIAIRNVSLPVRIKRGKVVLPRDIPFGHGYGLANVRTILDRYDGQLAFDYTAPWFQVTCLLVTFPDFAAA